MSNQPPLKWLGNKTQLAQWILDKFPQAKRLIDPMMGSASLFLNSNYESYVLSDYNEDLYLFYHAVQNDYANFLAEAQALFVDANANIPAYNALRNEFNTRACNTRHAALFLYLNKFGFNGICRYNKSGGFNVPCGAKNGVSPGLPLANLQELHTQLTTKTVELDHGDFRLVCANLTFDADTVVYFDPPYMPLEATCHTNYTADGFTLDDHRDMIDLIEQINLAGATVIVSNHDTPEVRQEYSRHRTPDFHLQEVTRAINTKSGSAKKVDELIMVFKP